MAHASRVPGPTGAMRPLWAIRARASQLGRSAPCTRETTASDTRNLSSSKSCGSEPVRARSVRPQSMSTRRSAELSRRTCSPSRALQDCCGDHPQPMQTEAARARARSSVQRRGFPSSGTQLFGWVQLSAEYLPLASQRRTQPMRSCVVGPALSPRGLFS